MGRSSRAWVIQAQESAPRSGRSGSAESCTRALNVLDRPTASRGPDILQLAPVDTPSAADADRRKVSGHIALHLAGTRSAGLLTGAAGRIHGP